MDWDKYFTSNSNDNTTSAHLQCRELAHVMVAAGVRHAVLSPGSRNAPLIIALAREPRIAKWVVTDERSAAFVAVGMAQRLQQPVMIACTSGSALLDYAPAIAEAYYRQLPIIVVSADRPREWIDQNDSQTIRQCGALAAVVKHSYDLPTMPDNDDSRWYANRLLNDAAITATTYPMGPVHINMPFGDPLCHTVAMPQTMPRIIARPAISHTLPAQEAQRLADTIATSRRVLVVAGFHHQSDSLNRALSHLAKHDNVAILTETISNLHDDNFIQAIDRTLASMPTGDAAHYAPQLLITMGGALVSKVAKKFLRRYPAEQEWRIGIDHSTIDTMQHLTMRIDTPPETFFTQIDGLLPAHDSTPQQNGNSYAQLWRNLAESALQRHQRYVAAAPWCDLKAFSMIIPSIPSNYTLHLSNGTSIRYAQLFGSEIKHLCYCNRGTSGIDGSTSTALGTSIVAPDGETSLLITGDMSFGYDLAGIASQYNSARFKVIVMCNGGGNIFRFLNGTSALPELEQYFEASRPVRFHAIAEAFGLSYYEAHSAATLAATLPQFYSCQRQALLAIYTPAQENATILRRYFGM